MLVKGTPGEWFEVGLFTSGGYILQYIYCIIYMASQINLRHLDCLFRSRFKQTKNKALTFRIIGLLWGEIIRTFEIFPSQRPFYGRRFYVTIYSGIKKNRKKTNITQSRTEIAASPGEYDFNDNVCRGRGLSPESWGNPRVIDIYMASTRLELIVSLDPLERIRKAKKNQCYLIMPYRSVTYYVNKYVVVFKSRFIFAVSGHIYFARPFLFPLISLIKSGTSSC